MRLLPPILPLFILVFIAHPLVASTLIVANKSDDTVDLIDPTTGKSLATLETGHAPHEVVVSPDGKRAVVSNYGDRAAAGSTLTVIDLPARKPIRTIELGDHTRPHGLAWLEGARIAVTTEGSAHLLVVDVKKGEIVAKIPTGQTISHMVAVTSDLRRAFVANIGSGSTTVIDLTENKKLGDIETGAGAEGVAVRPGTSEVWVTNRAADTISVIDTETLEITATVDCEGFPIRIAFTPDGKHALVSAARSGEVVRLDAEARKALARRKLDFSKAPDADRRLFGDQFGESPVPVGLVVTADGASAFVAATQSDVVAVIDPVTLEVRRLIRAGREPDGMAIAP
jgi:YVTN family beta-propeller protein